MAENRYEQEHNRRTDILMKVLADKAQTILTPRDYDEWFKDTHDWVLTTPEYAERAMLALRVAEVLKQGGSTYDAMLYAARAECSSHVSKDEAVRYAHQLTNKDMAEFRAARREAYRAVDAFSNEQHIGLHGLHRELFDKYEAHRTGTEYIEPVVDEDIQADLRTVSDALIDPSALEIWNYHMENEFARGQEGIENIKATIDILAAYESGAPLQDVKDMIYLVENMTICDGDELRYNLFQAQDGRGFGCIHPHDMQYLQDETLLITPPEKSIPQAYFACVTHIDNAFGFDIEYEEFTQYISDALETQGADAEKNLQAGLDYLELLHNGASLEEIQQQFAADERFKGVDASSIAGMVEDLSHIEGIQNYLIGKGPEPVDTRTGPTGPEDHNDHGFTIPGE